jgi:hypothetical protein
MKVFIKNPRNEPKLFIINHKGTKEIENKEVTLFQEDKF